MRGTAITRSLFTEVMRRLRRFGDFVTVPLAIVIFLGVAGVCRLYLVLAGVAAWTLLEYLVHRIIFHRILRADAFIGFIMTIQTIRTQKGPASVRRSLHSRLDFC
jgi:hypothetical protein